MVVQLRYYQIDVIDRSRGRIAAGIKRLIIQAPTGAGKTHIACEIIRLAVAKGSRVLFLVHRRRLVKQISDRLTLFGIHHGVIMAGVRPTPALVQVASRDTFLSRYLHSGSHGFPPADLVIVDECHNMKLVGADNEDELAGYEAILKVYPQAVILGLDATPARTTGHGLGSFFQAIECTVPVSQLIREDFLVPVRCYAPERMGQARRAKKKVKGPAGNPVSWWRKLADGRPTVAFVSRVEQSQALVASFNQAGIPAAHIDAKTSDEERERIISEVQAGRVLVVSNVGVMTEGVDIPELSCCILLRMASSYVLYAQTVGRIMRAHPGKKDAILLDHAAACYVHGLPDDDVEWTLDEGDTVDRRQKDANLTPPGRKPIVCPRCAFVFRGASKCPACGHVLAKRLRPVETQDELLTEVERKIEPLRERDNHIRLWKQCLGQAAHLGRTMKTARIMYKQRTGDWPQDDFPHGEFNREELDQPVADLLPQYVSRRTTA